MAIYDDTRFKPNPFPSYSDLENFSKSESAGLNELPPFKSYEDIYVFKHLRGSIMGSFSKRGAIKIVESMAEAYEILSNDGYIYNIIPLDKALGGDVPFTDAALMAISDYSKDNRPVDLPVMPEFELRFLRSPLMHESLVGKPWPYVRGYFEVLKALEKSITSLIIELAKLPFYGIYSRLLSAIVGKFWNSIEKNIITDTQHDIICSIILLQQFVAGEEKYVNSRKDILPFTGLYIRSIHLYLSEGVIYPLITVDSPIWKFLEEIYSESIIFDLLKRSSEQFSEFGDERVCYKQTINILSLCREASTKTEVIDKCALIAQMVLTKFFKYFVSTQNTESRFDRLAFAPLIRKLFGNDEEVVKSKLALSMSMNDILLNLFDFLTNLGFDKWEKKKEVEYNSYEVVRLINNLIIGFFRQNVNIRMPHPSQLDFPEWEKFCAEAGYHMLHILNGIFYRLSTIQKQLTERKRVLIFEDVNIYNTVVAASYKRALSFEHSHVYPLPVPGIYDVQKIHKSWDWNNNRIEGFGKLRKMVGTHVLFNCERIRELGLLLRGGRRSENLILANIFGFIYRKACDETYKSLTSYEFNKLVCLIIWLNQIFTHYKYSTRFNEQCLLLHLPREVDWRGRIYVKGLGSVTDTTLYRFLITSGYEIIGRNEVKVLLASNAMLLGNFKDRFRCDSIENIAKAYGSWREYLSLEKVDNWNACLEKQLLDVTSALNLYFREKTIIEYYLEEEKGVVTRTCSTAEFDHTSSGPQINAAALGDERLAFLTNAWSETQITSLDDYIKAKPKDIYTDAKNHFQKSRVGRLLSSNNIDLPRSVFKSFIMKQFYGKTKYRLILEDILEEGFKSKGIVAAWYKYLVKIYNSKNKKSPLPADFAKSIINFLTPVKGNKFDDKLELDKGQLSNIYKLEHKEASTVYKALEHIVNERYSIYNKFLLVCRDIIYMRGMAKVRVSLLDKEVIFIVLNSLLPEKVILRQRINIENLMSSTLGINKDYLSAYAAEQLRQKQIRTQTNKDLLDDTFKMIEAIKSSDNLPEDTKFKEEIRDKNIHVNLKRKYVEIDCTLNFKREKPTKDDWDRRAIKLGSVANITHARDAQLISRVTYFLNKENIFPGTVHDMYILHPAHFQKFYNILANSFDFIIREHREVLLGLFRESILEINKELSGLIKDKEKERRCVLIKRRKDIEQIINSLTSKIGLRHIGMLVGLK